MSDDLEQKGLKKVELASQAKTILDHPLFRAAVQAVRDDVWKQFCQTPPANVEAMRLLRLTVGNLESLITKLHHHVQGGVIGEKEVETAKRRREHRRD